MQRGKTILFDIKEKRTQQVLDDMAMTSGQRIDRMFQLMKFYASIHPSKTLFFSSPSDLPYIVLKKRDESTV